MARHYSTSVIRKNSHGLVVEEAYFDMGGKSVPKAETVDFDTDGNQVRAEKSYAKVTRRYDDHNALIEEAYFGPGGEPVVGDEGWARITYINDKSGQAIERAHFGVRGEPVIGKYERYHRGKRVLDERNNMLELAVFGTDDKPIEIVSDGVACAKFIWHRDSNGIEKSWECFNAKGKRIR
jgi:hypothetical protein